MVARVVELGTPRSEAEGVRIGTVRRPPRGVPKSELASRDWYDVWLPMLAPSAEVVKLAHTADSPAQWETFKRRYLAEMAKPDPSRLLDLLAALSHHTNFSVGCYCEDEAHCHRSVLRRLLIERQARVE